MNCVERTTHNLHVDCCYFAGGYNISMTLQLPIIAHQILATYEIPIIDYYNLSMALYDDHVTIPQSISGKLDCMHFCRPGLGEVPYTNVISV